MIDLYAHFVIRFQDFVNQIVRLNLKHTQQARAIEFTSKLFTEMRRLCKIKSTLKMSAVEKLQVTLFNKDTYLKETRPRLYKIIPRVFIYT